MAGIGLIANPNSRRNRANKNIIRHLREILGSNGELVETRSLEEVYKAAEAFKRQEIDILALNGGDGTNHYTLSVFLEVYGEDPLPPIAFLRGGTMNTTAWDCGLKMGSPETLLRRLIHRYEVRMPLEEVERNIMKVGKSYGFLFGNGLIANYLEAYYEGGNASMLKAATTLTKGILSSTVQGPFIKRLFQRIEAEVIVDGETWPNHVWDTIAAGTIGHIGLGFYPFFKALQQPGKIHVLGIGCGPVRTIRQLPRIFASRETNDPELWSVVADRIELHAREPFSYTVDGDIYTCRDSLVLEVGPRLVTVHG